MDTRRVCRANIVRLQDEVVLSRSRHILPCLTYLVKPTCVCCVFFPLVFHADRMLYRNIVIGFTNKKTFTYYFTFGLERFACRVVETASSTQVSFLN